MNICIIISKMIWYKCGLWKCELLSCPIRHWSFGTRNQETQMSPLDPCNYDCVCCVTPRHSGKQTKSPSFSNSSASIFRPHWKISTTSRFINIHNATPDNDGKLLHNLHMLQETLSTQLTIVVVLCTLSSATLCRGWKLSSEIHRDAQDA